MKRIEKRTAEGWSSMLARMENRTGLRGRTCENARNAGRQVADRLSKVPCGVIEGGVFLQTKVKEEVYESEELLTMGEALDVRVNKYWNAFVNDPASSRSDARKIMDVYGAWIKKAGGGTQSLVRIGEFGWIMECSGVKKAALRNTLWELWSERLPKTNAVPDRFKQLCFEECEKFRLSGKSGDGS